MEYKYETENEKIEDTAGRWCTNREKADFAKLMSYLFVPRIWKKLFSKFSYIDEDDFTGIFIDAMIDVINTYKPEKNSKFLAYFWSMIPYRIQDKLREKEIYKHIVHYEERDDDSDEESSDISLDYVSYSAYMRDGINNMDIVDSAHDNVHIYMAITARLNALRLSNNINDLKKFKKHSMVHTDVTATFIKDSPSEEYASILISLIDKHKDEVYKTMDCGFLDYFTVDKCDTPKKILRTPLKKLGEVADISDEKRRSEECKLPLEAIVYIKYYALHNITADKTTISKQRKDYRKMGMKETGDYFIR